MKENDKNKVNIVSNDAVRGKPYLDIDRVINEVGSGTSSQMENNGEES